MIYFINSYGRSTTNYWFCKVNVTVAVKMTGLGIPFMMYGS